jgi:hypothetical protein
VVLETGRVREQQSIMLPRSEDEPPLPPWRCIEIELDVPTDSGDTQTNQHKRAWRIRGCGDD